MTAAETPYTANEDLYVGVNFARAKGSTISGAEVKQFGWEDRVTKATGVSARTADSTPESDGDAPTTNSPITNTRGKVTDA
jgi:hypothetical protein